MRSVTYISDNGTNIHFGSGDGSPYYFGSLTDSAGATAETTRAPRQDGQSTGHIALDGRTIILQAQTFSLGDSKTSVRRVREEHKDYLYKTFRTNTFGKLIYHRETDDVMIRARALGTPTLSEDDNPSLVDISIDLQSDMPDWVQCRETVIPLGGKFKLWHFPWAPRKAPWGVYRKRGLVDNPWVEDIFPTIEIYDTSKDVSIFNDTTGALLRIDHPILEGQKMVVDTQEMYAALYAKDEKGDYVESLDATHYITMDSSVSWTLCPGRNVVRIKNEDDTIAPLSYLRYHLPVGGI